LQKYLFGRASPAVLGCTLADYRQSCRSFRWLNQLEYVTPKAGLVQLFTGLNDRMQSRLGKGS
jgi:hypothetical protein